MKTQYPFSVSISIKLDGSGNGTAEIGPQGAYAWSLGPISISTLNQSVTTVPSCTVYAGSSATPSNFVDDTFNGQGNTTTKGTGQLLYQGQAVFAIWTGGVPGDTATLKVSGTQITGYR